MPVSAAKKDARAQRLLTEVASLGYRVKYHRSTNPRWGCSVEGQVAHVYFEQTNHPASSLAHELLHVIVQHRGYRPLRIGFSTIDQTANFKRVLECLDNELQHHKMFPEFQARGFPPEEFYADDDTQVLQHLEGVLSSPREAILDVIPDFLTVIAPGGTLSESERLSLEARFMAIHEGRFQQQLTTLRAAMDTWVRSTSYDARETLRAIFLGIQNPCFTWFGYSDSDRPPKDGFFIDREFSVDESGTS